MPIVGIEIFSVISFEVFGEIHSNTIEKAVKKYTTEVKLEKFPKKKNFLYGTKNR